MIESKRDDELACKNWFSKLVDLAFYALVSDQKGGASVTLTGRYISRCWGFTRIGLPRAKPR